MISGDSSGSDFVGMSEISRFKGDSRSPPSTSRHCCSFIPWQLDWEQGRTRLGQKVWHGAVVSRATRFATNLAEWLNIWHNFSIIGPNFPCGAETFLFAGNASNLTACFAQRWRNMVFCKSCVDLPDIVARDLNHNLLRKCTIRMTAAHNWSNRHDTKNLVSYLKPINFKFGLSIKWSRGRLTALFLRLNSRGSRASKFCA